MPEPIGQILIYCTGVLACLICIRKAVTKGSYIHKLYIGLCSFVHQASLNRSIWIGAGLPFASYEKLFFIEYRFHNIPRPSFSLFKLIYYTHTWMPKVLESIAVIFLDAPSANETLAPLHDWKGYSY